MPTMTDLTTVQAVLSLLHRPTIQLERPEFVALALNLGLVAFPLGSEPNTLSHGFTP